MEKKNLFESSTPRIVLAGSVSSSFFTLKKLLEHQMNVVGVFGYEPKNEAAVSGYVNMRCYCEEQQIPYHPFVKIGEDSLKERLSSLHPDLFFVVGLSQLVPGNMLQLARIGNVGFHPTCLPKGRGRAPVAWLVLEEQKGASTFFLMGKGADDGPILAQKEFAVSNEDDATSIEQKFLAAIGEALDEWLPGLKQGYWNPVPQEELLATYYGKRNPEDGWINWALDAERIVKLVRATSRPFPGAYTFLRNDKISVFKACTDDQHPIKGVIGRVLMVKNESYLVQTGEGKVWISELTSETGEPVVLQVGQRLGYYSELEIYTLKKEIQSIKKKIGL